ncbi:MAG: PRC-barrel domain-containing protein [bacterium]|nr:PRC-barrel domain-containing protein [bacterium]
MTLTKQDIINLPVYTQSNQHLGKVVDFEISTHTHTIEKYIVRNLAIVGGILKRDLLIAPSQVISITKEKMIVDDTLTKQEEFEKVATTA